MENHTEYLPDWALVPSNAINGAIEHYFENLTVSPADEEGIMFISQMLEAIEPWLFLTEQSMTHIKTSIESNIKNVNLIYSLTTLFELRMSQTTQERSEYIRRLAMAFTSPGKGPSSIVPEDYALRVPGVEENINMLTSNRFLVMIATMVMFMNTNLLAARLPGK